MGAVYAIFAGFYYWIGKITGYQYNEVLGRIHFILFTIAINLVFFPMHMLGQAGIFLFLFNSEILIDISSITFQSLSLIVLKPYGPHIKPRYLKEPIRIYTPNLNQNLIGKENKNRTIIYQWINQINGSIYIGSASNGSNRLLSYFRFSTLKKNLPIYKSLTYYTHNNFIQAILEDQGRTGSISKEFLLLREQFYLDLLFKNNTFPLSILNLSPNAGSTLGYKHTAEFIKNKTGKLNPMFGKKFSPEFIYMQTRDKKGKNNPIFGKKKSSSTIAKLVKLIYVYNAKDLKFLGSYSTVNCIKVYKLGKETFYKYLDFGRPFKGKIFSRKPLNS